MQVGGGQSPVLLAQKIVQHLQEFTLPRRVGRNAAAGEDGGVVIALIIDQGLGLPQLWGKIRRVLQGQGHVLPQLPGLGQGEVFVDGAEQPQLQFLFRRGGVLGQTVQSQQRFPADREEQTGELLHVQHAAAQVRRVFHVGGGVLQIEQHQEDRETPFVRHTGPKKGGGGAAFALGHVRVGLPGLLYGGVIGVAAGPGRAGEGDTLPDLFHQGGDVLLLHFGFGDVVQGAAFQGHPDIGKIVVGGQHRRADGGLLRAQGLEQLNAVPARHADVGDQQVHRLLHTQGVCLVAVRRFQQREILSLGLAEHDFQPVSDEGVVVSDQNCHRPGRLLLPVVWEWSP